MEQLSDVVKDGWASIWTNYHAKQLMFPIRNKPNMMANIAKLRTGMISVIYLSYKISIIDPNFVYKFTITFFDSATNNQLLSVHSFSNKSP